MEVVEEGRRLCTEESLHCHHQNVSCIMMGSNESHFNVSLTAKDKVTRQCPQTTIVEEKGEPKRIRTEVPLRDTLICLHSLLYDHSLHPHPP